MMWCRVWQLLSVRRAVQVPRRPAGHNKWSNIRHIKGAKDHQRSLKFNRLTKLMRTAVVEAGADPASNLRLENLIEQARAVNMPNSTIQGVLRGAERDRGNAQPGMVELTGPAGACLVVEVLTDNYRRCVNDITIFLRRHRTRLGPARHAFGRRGVVVTDAADLEAAVEHAIDAGAEDVERDTDADADDPVLVFSADVADVPAVRKALARRGYTVRQAEVLYVPQVTVPLSGQHAELHDALVDRLNELDEVTRVWTNAEIER